CGLLLVGIAVSTDYWLYMEEGTVLPQNQTTEVKMALHAGLWRVCFFAGREKGRCVFCEYFLEPEINLVTENTENILKTVRTATPFPMVSLFLVFTAFVISNIGHIRPQRTILAFVSGIFFILSGLSLVVGLVLYISSINDEVMNRPSSSEQYFHYRYGWSFAFAASSFLLKEVMCWGPEDPFEGGALGWWFPPWTAVFQPVSENSQPGSQLLSGDSADLDPRPHLLLLTLQIPAFSTLPALLSH
ncbi:voltage-dependent calcium channel gamma-7 subunit isoform X1, partial [Cricetulus griseus]|uniref:voltage-dependent calcium channel gamma-7 subunit isoform X1 n=1 Tax=Cricetulus griseus TaxID=10029 RepID=UPI000454774A